MPLGLFRRKTPTISDDELNSEVEQLQKKADEILESSMELLKEQEKGIINREKVLNLCNRVKVFRNTYILNNKNPTEYLMGLDKTFPELLRACSEILESEV